MHYSLSLIGLELFGLEGDALHSLEIAPWEHAYSLPKCLRFWQRRPPCRRDTYNGGHSRCRWRAKRMVGSLRTVAAPHGGGQRRLGQQRTMPWHAEGAWARERAFHNSLLQGPAHAVGGEPAIGAIGRL